MTTALVLHPSRVARLASCAKARAQVQANLVTRTHCRRGHRWTEANTRWDAKGRKCRQCERVTSGRAKLRALLRPRLIASHPDHGGSRRALTAVLRQWKDATA